MANDKLITGKEKNLSKKLSDSEISGEKPVKKKIAQPRKKKVSQVIEAAKNVSLNKPCDSDVVISQIKDLEKKFALQLVQVFDNISFDEEVEVIKESIEDSSFQLKKEIQQVKNLLGAHNPDIKLDQPIQGTLNDYAYTMLDVENDMVKIRKLLDDMSKSVEKEQEINQENIKDITSTIASVVELLESSEGQYSAEVLKSFQVQFDILNDDISSISKRTNKLVLTSEDVGKELKKNVADFSFILSSLNKDITKISQIDKKIDNSNKMLMSSIKSDKVLNEAFMHLAQWIDDASEKIKNIDENVARINSGNNEFLLRELINKVEAQQQVINSYESRFAQILSQKQNEEMKTLLEFTAGQAQASNENSKGNKLMLQRMEALEKNILKFEQTIKKITSHVEEA